MKLILTTVSSIDVLEPVFSKSRICKVQNKEENSSYQAAMSLHLKLAIDVIRDVGIIVWLLVKIKLLMPYFL